jgi:hypothetical protein
MVGIGLAGFLAGVYLRGGAGLPHVLQSCASATQYLTEFRLDERGADRYGSTLYVRNAEVFVDGERIGRIAPRGPGLRHFLCEGNHEARLVVSRLGGIPEEHRLKFAVARPAFFHLTELSEEEPQECSSGPCSLAVGLELSPLTPEQNEARIQRVGPSQR